MKGAELIIRPQGYSKFTHCCLMLQYFLNPTIVHYQNQSVSRERSASSSEQNNGLVQPGLCCRGERFWIRRSLYLFWSFGNCWVSAKDLFIFPDNSLATNVFSFCIARFSCDGRTLGECGTEDNG